MRKLQSGKYIINLSVIDAAPFFFIGYGESDFENHKLHCN